MRRAIISIAVVALLAGGAYAVSKVMCGGPSAVASQASVATTASDCESGAGAGDAACAPTSGKIAGNFDALMSGACKFACATKEKYDAKDVVAQPGAVAGRLTQCPVSGVVFAVDASRPHVPLGGDEYVTCCETCAGKLKNDASHYLSGTNAQAGVTEAPTLRIQLLSFEGCPNTVKARDLLQGVIASAGFDASIEEVDLDSPATPVAMRGWGSPTILVNGKDVGGLETPPGTSCRIYRDEAGRHAGYPSAALLRAALITPREPVADRSF